MATVYLMQNGAAKVTFSNSSLNDGSRIKWSVGSNTTGSADYKYTYSCPSGSTVYGSATKKTGSGTVWDAYFQVGSNSYAVPTGSFSKSYPASGSTSIGFNLYCNGWNTGGASVRVWGATIYVSYTSTYTLTVRAGTGISAVSGGGTYNDGTSKQITATVKTGYKWSKWTNTSGGTQYSTTQNPTITVKSNLDLTAVATPITYTIAYNSNGGTGTMSSTSATYDAYATLRNNTFTKSKYIFKGWATSASGSKTYDNQQQVKNLSSTQGATITLYAVWELDPNQVFVNSTKVYSNGWK